MSFDRDAVLEQAAKVLDPWVVTHHHGCHEPADEDWGSSLSTKEPDEAAHAVLPVIVDPALAPIEALHQSVPTTEILPNGVRIPWRACSCGFRTHSACPTARAIAEIKAASR